MGYGGGAHRVAQLGAQAAALAGRHRQRPGLSITEGFLLAVAGQGTNEQEKSQLLFVLLPAPLTHTSPLSRCHTTKTPPTTAALVLVKVVETVEKSPGSGRSSRDEAIECMPHWWRWYR